VSPHSSPLPPNAFLLSFCALYRGIETHRGRQWRHRSSPSRALFLVRFSAPKPSRIDRVHLLFRFELMSGQVVVGKGGDGVLRRAHGVGHGGHRPDLREVAGFSTVHLMMNTNRWIRDEGLRLEDTPSRGKLLKEPLSFLIINPPSIAYC
jgi:hypothetical protein